MATDLEKLIGEIRSLSPEDQGRVRQALAAELQTNGNPPPKSRDLNDLEYQQQLAQWGLLKSVKPRVRDQEAFERFNPVKVSGKPVSETIIEERR